MKAVLIYKNRKVDPIVWDISTPELLNKAALALFKYLDEEWEVYQDLEEAELKEDEERAKQEEILMAHIANLPLITTVQLRAFTAAQSELAQRRSQQALYLEAKQGSAKAALKLLRMRDNYEYETWNIVDVQEEE